MDERYFTQTEWQGIQFRELGVALDPSRPATPEFYDAFYAELKRRFTAVDQLPEGWLRNKRQTADCLSQMISPNDTVMSFGCGIGVVEAQLINSHGVSELYLWDSARTAAHYEPALYDRYLSELSPASSGGRSYDVVYLVQVLYALSESEAVDVLGELRALLRPGGCLISMDTSTDPRENGEQLDGVRPGRWAARAKSLRLLKPLRAAVQSARADRTTGDQGWGWARDNDRVESLLRRAGFASVSFSSCAGQSMAVAR